MTNLRGKRNKIDGRSRETAHLQRCSNVAVICMVSPLTRFLSAVAISDTTYQHITILYNVRWNNEIEVYVNSADN